MGLNLRRTAKHYHSFMEISHADLFRTESCRSLILNLKEGKTLIMKTVDLLERDKERLMTRLEKADNAEQTRAVLDDELGRIQLMYSESSEDPEMNEEAGYALSVIRAAIPLIDSTGEVKTYERSVSSPDGAFPVLPAAAGACISLAGALVLAFSSSVLMPVGMTAVIAGAAVLFLAGMRAGAKKAKPPKTDRIVDVTLDYEKIIRNLSHALAIADKNLDDAALRMQVQKEESAELQTDAGGMLQDQEMELISGLLTSAYGAPDENVSQTVISDVRFYLHKKGIEVLDYSEENRRMFARMPGKKAATLKPALVKDGKVLVKGLVTGM